MDTTTVVNEPKAATEPMLIEVSEAQLFLVDSFIRTAKKLNKNFTREQAITRCLDFGVDELRRRDERLIETHNKEEFSKGLKKLDEMFLILVKTGKMSAQDYVNELDSLKRKYGQGLSVGVVEQVAVTDKK